MVDINVNKECSMIWVHNSIIGKGAAAGSIVSDYLRGENVVNAAARLAGRDFRWGAMLADEYVLEVKPKDQAGKVFVVEGVAEPRVDITS
jgi:hypothetical protein